MPELRHVDYPHNPGYLFDCEACEDGPCQCAEPCYDQSCLYGEFGYTHAPGYAFAHNAPCVSSNCEHPERDSE